MAGFTAVAPGEDYTEARGYGFDLGSTVMAIEGGGVTGAEGRAILFSARLTPGTYEVSVTLGGVAASATTVKAETRRLVVEDVHVGAGERKRETFLVHVRVPTFGDGGMVRLKPREKEAILYAQWGETRVAFKELDWDEKLTLEFSGTGAAVQAVEIVQRGRRSARRCF